MLRTQSFLQFHDKNRFVSSMLVFTRNSPPLHVQNLSETNAISSPQTPHPSTMSRTSNISKSDSYQSVGVFNLSWIDRVDSTDFVFQVKTLGLQSIWAAFAFSETITMVQTKLHTFILFLAYSKNFPKQYLNENEKIKN